jgi:hypothetical protein
MQNLYYLFIMLWYINIFFYAYQTYLVSHLSQVLFVRMSRIRGGRSYTYAECPYLDDDWGQHEYQ